MRVKFAALADAANVADGKLNLLGVFEMILARKFPATHPMVALAATIQLDPHEVGVQQFIKLVVADSHGQPTWTSPKPIEVLLELQDTTIAITDENAPSISLVVNIAGLKLPHEGQYRFRILVNETIIHEVPLQASILPLPNEEDAK